MNYRDEEDISTSEFECPNCGERVHTDLLVCPKCGLHFYAGDREETTGDETSEYRSGISIWAIAAGWVVSTAVAFIINLFVSRIWANDPSALLATILLFLAAPLGGLAGGYLAARLAGNRVLWHGLGVSVLSLASAFVLEAYWHDLAVEPLSILTLASWVLMLIMGPLGGWFWLSLAGLTRFPQMEKQNDRQQYQDLLARVRHNIDTAERLIDYERRRSPNATRAQWIDSALSRLDRDNR